MIRAVPQKGRKKKGREGFAAKSVSPWPAVLDYPARCAARHTGGPRVTQGAASQPTAAFCSLFFLPFCGTTLISFPSSFLNLIYTQKTTMAPVTRTQSGVYSRFYHDRVTHELVWAPRPDKQPTSEGECRVCNKLTQVYVCIGEEYNSPHFMCEDCSIVCPEQKADCLGTKRLCRDCAGWCPFCSVQTCWPCMNYMRCAHTESICDACSKTSDDVCSICGWAVCHASCLETCVRCGGKCCGNGNINDIMCISEDKVCQRCVQ